MLSLKEDCRAPFSSVNEYNDGGLHAAAVEHRRVSSEGSAIGKTTGLIDRGSSLHRIMAVGGDTAPPEREFFLSSWFSSLFWAYDCGGWNCHEKLRRANSPGSEPPNAYRGKHGAP